MAVPELGGHVGAGGVWTPLQAESVVITTRESYAILESVETMERQMAEASTHGADHTFLIVHPKEGGRCILNLKYIIGFVSQGDEGQA